jgi:hypothetical protein
VPRGYIVHRGYDADRLWKEERFSGKHSVIVKLSLS